MIDSVHLSRLIAILAVLLLMLFAKTITGQVKYEREYRIPAKEVPEQAVSFVKGCISQKVKWYREENIKNISIEAKTHIRETKYSIEFDKLGNIRDIEFIISFGDIPEYPRKRIKHQLDSLFQKHKIIKVQQQYTGEAQALKELLCDNTSQKPYNTRYEIVMAGKREKLMQKHEILTEKNGLFQKISRIMPQDMDNLIY